MTIEPPLPNLLLAGIPKSATTSVARALGCSEDVDPGVTKEPGILANPDYDLGQVRHLYSRHFRKSNRRLRLDSTPWSLYSTLALHRVGRACPPGQRIPVLVILREPWSRMRSMYLDQVRRGREQRTFDEALLASERALGTSAEPLTTHYAETTMYGRHLEPWGAAPYVDLRIAFFDDVVDAAEEVRNAIENWLSTQIGPLETSNSRGEGTPRFAAAIDKAVQVGTALPPSVRSRVRPPLATLARVLLEWSPRVGSPEDRADSTDHELASRLDARFTADAPHVLGLVRNGRSLLPDPPPWVQRGARER